MMRNCRQCNEPLTYPYINHPGPVHMECHEAYKADRGMIMCDDCGVQNYTVANNFQTYGDRRCTPCYLKAHGLGLQMLVFKTPRCHG